MEESREHNAEDLGSGSWHSPQDAENGMYWPSLLSHLLPVPVYLPVSLSITQNFYDIWTLPDSSRPIFEHLHVDRGDAVVEFY